jgi:hypothetical protein
VNRCLAVTTVDPEPGPACSITPNVPLGPTCRVAYRLVPIDLHDPAHPCAGVPINVPGVAFGASTQDPSIVYFVEYSPGVGTGTWANVIRVGKLAGNDCTVEGTLSLSGLVGQPYVQNDGAYVSVGGALHHLDLTNPAAPVDMMLPGPYSGWGTLVSLDGDVALVASGWGGWNDVYVLGGSNTPPVFVQTARPPPFASLDSPGVRLSGKRRGTTVYYPAGDFGVAAVLAP